DAVTFSLVSGPVGLTVADTGLARWRPTAGQAGSFLVVLQVSDGQGGTATQEYVLQVQQQTAPPANNAPVITSTLPAGPLGVGLPFVHDVQAQDAEGDRLTYLLEGALPGMDLDPDSGRFRWIPAADQLGSQQVEVVVSDGRGGEDRRRLSFSVEASPANEAPVIRSRPRIETRLDLPYVSPVDAFDSNGNPLTFTLITAPVGMTVGADGFVNWLPTPDQVGTHPVALLVSDSRGGTAMQGFDLTVVTSPTNAPPATT